MASQIGSVSHDEMCASSSTKCANGGIAKNGAGARNLRENRAADSGAGLDGPCGAIAGRNSDQHACRLHVIRVVRKSVFTLRMRVCMESAPVPRWRSLERL